jgi:uncharacterized protein YndB with AHSA1/START domain
VRYFLILVAVLAVLILAIVGIGYAIPKHHVAVAEATYHQPPDAIWQAITDYSKFPEWRKTVKSVQPLPPVNGILPSWIEVDMHGNAIPFLIVSWLPQQSLVTSIADPKLPFGGTWTYEIRAANGGTTLRITENGDVRNPVFRFISRYVMGYRATLETYLGALGEKFGETVVVTDPAQK